MTEKEIKENGATNAYQPKLVIKGITTSQVQQALKADNPYPARVFLKSDCATCFSEKRQCFHSYSKTDIPIFFRIKENNQWIKPKIKTGSYLEVQGYFNNITSKNTRPSFTAYSYQLLTPEARIESQIARF